MYSIFIVFILLLSTMHRVVLIHWMLRRTVRARSTRVLYERSISMHTTSRSMHTVCTTYILRLVLEYGY